MWNKAFEAVGLIWASPMEDREPVSPLVYERSMKLIMDLTPLVPAPNCVYESPDSNIIFQWGAYPGNVLFIEVETSSIEIMVSFPDKDPVFRSFQC